MSGQIGLPTGHSTPYPTAIIRLRGLVTSGGWRVGEQVKEGNDWDLNWSEMVGNTPAERLSYAFNVWRMESESAWHPVRE